MCYKAEYFYSIREKLPIKKICLILAIINAIANALLFLGCIYGAYSTFEHRHPRTTGSSGLLRAVVWDFELPVAGLAMFVTAIFSLLTFIFSVLLCVGIRKRRPAFLKAYIVYGVVISCVLIFVSIMILRSEDNSGLGIGVLCGCDLHALYIGLVYQTRLKVQEEMKSTDILLQEVNVDTRPIISDAQALTPLQIT